MVTIKSYFLNQNGEGKPYICLELIGEIEFFFLKKQANFVKYLQELMKLQLG